VGRSSRRRRRYSRWWRAELDAAARLLRWICATAVLGLLAPAGAAAERAAGISGNLNLVRFDRRLVARARRFTVRLRVIATDAAGNRVTVVKRIGVRPAARR
jgi:hypothetical protein